MTTPEVIWNWPKDETLDTEFSGIVTISYISKWGGKGK